MPEPQRYTYILNVDGRALGPFDRRTIVGMRTKKLITGDQRILRNDGFDMTVRDVVDDKFEMADKPQDLRTVIASSYTGPTSGLWPTFAVNYGGGTLKAGAFGFVGTGELRYQGDVLRFMGSMKTGVLTTKEDRIKLPATQIERLDPEDSQVKITLDVEAAKTFNQGVAVLQLQMESAGAVGDLIGLMRLGQH